MQKSMSMMFFCIYRVFIVRSRGFRRKRLKRPGSFGAAMRFCIFPGGGGTAPSAPLSARSRGNAFFALFSLFGTVLALYKGKETG
jgi:hypothetical protein